jgi:hypothetical protein
MALGGDALRRRRDCCIIHRGRASCRGHVHVLA